MCVCQSREAKVRLVQGGRGSRNKAVEAPLPVRQLLIGRAGPYPTLLASRGCPSALVAKLHRIERRKVLRAGQREPAADVTQMRPK
jgi:hypothetical protein